MSAFVVLPETMELAVSGLLAGKETTWSAADELGRELFRLNLQTVLERYPDCTAEDAPGVVEGYDYSKWTWRPCWTKDHRGWPITVQDSCNSLKALECLQYQMTEGQTVPAHPLYQQITEGIADLQSHVVGLLPEYEVAPWDSPAMPEADSRHAIDTVYGNGRHRTIRSVDPGQPE